MRIPFSQLLEAYLEPYGNGGSRILSDATEKQGTRISVRSIQRYRSSMFTPSFEYAQIIVKALNIDISDDDLVECLALEKEKQQISHQSINKKQIIINLSEISNVDRKKLMEDIRKKAETLYPGVSNSINKYIIGLILNDLDRGK